MIMAVGGFHRSSSICVSLQVTAPSFGPVTTHELLHHMTGKGLSARYHFPRQPCLYQPSMVSVQLTLTNGCDHGLEQIHVGERSPAGLNIHCFNTIGESMVGNWDVVKVETSRVRFPRWLQDSGRDLDFFYENKELKVRVSFMGVVGETEPGRGCQITIKRCQICAEVTDIPSLKH